MPSALVVADGMGRGALAGVRALGRAGWDVGVAGPGPALAARSRWCSHTHRVPFAEAAGLGYDAVLPTSDEAMAALGATDVLDKSAVAAASAAVGLQVPEATDGLPAVVKPRSHAVQRVHAVVVHTVAARNQAVAAIEAAGGEALVQRFVAGTLMAVVVVAGPAGERLGWVQQRAEAVWPEPAGVSCRAVTERADPGLVDAVYAVVAALGGTGVAQAQFLEEDGGPRHLVDLNARLYGSVALAMAAGLPVATMVARLAAGLPVTPVGEGRAGVRFRWLEGDARRALGSRSARPLLPPGRSVGPIWDRHDPLPAAVTVADLARRLARQ